MENELKNYQENIYKHIIETLDMFPYLTCALIPKSDYPEFVLKGLLIESDYLISNSLTIKTAQSYFKNLLLVRVVIPLDYRMTGCKIYDVNKVIDWNKLPDEHRHFNGSFDYGNLICSHLPEEVPDMDNPILENLRTTFKLFLAYNYYIKTKQWKMEEYKHGESGKKEYEQRRLKRKAK